MLSHQFWGRLGTLLVFIHACVPQFLSASITKLQAQEFDISNTHRVIRRKLCRSRKSPVENRQAGSIHKPMGGGLRFWDPLLVFFAMIFAWDYLINR